MGNDTVVSGEFDKRSTESLAQNASTVMAILTTFAGIILSRLVTAKPWFRSYPFLVEFLLISVPGVLVVTVGSNHAGHFLALVFLLLAIFIYRSRSLPLARRRLQFELGARRPTVLTLVRSLTHLITAICILAIDFNSFHRPFRKSRFFGAHLMDTGIGLFVVTMGLVSRRPKSGADVRRALVWSALPLLLLGFGRTVVIMAIGYNQDEHEYGKHLNAFFTLGLTKFCGTFLAAMTKSNGQLLALSLGLVIAHQWGLSFGLSDYVMSDKTPRSNLLSTNREGLLSLPGFVVIYLQSICFSNWLLSKKQLTHAEILHKLWNLLYIVLFDWTLFVVSAYLFGISRVTCNFGYVVWMLSITSTMIWIGIFVCDYIINTVLPLPMTASPDSLEQGVLSEGDRTAPEPEYRTKPFVICEAVNDNGLTFFMLANVTTGAVNIFLAPPKRSDSASICILLAYMFLVIGVVHLLYKKGVRIA